MPSTQAEQDAGLSCGAFTKCCVSIQSIINFCLQAFLGGIRIFAYQFVCASNRAKFCDLVDVLSQGLLCADCGRDNLRCCWRQEVRIRLLRVPRNREVQVARNGVDDTRLVATNSYCVPLINMRNPCCTLKAAMAKGALCICV